MATEVFIFAAGVNAGLFYLRRREKRDSTNLPPCRQTFQPASQTLGILFAEPRSYDSMPTPLRHRRNGFAVLTFSEREFTESCPTISFRTSVCEDSSCWFCWRS